ncbi:MULTISPECIES: hypothetical protein [unclassified Nocardia]|uniref:hypothetical protein n=1 Tax=unclassified Nocardia TaxID=2637762 RepID=UPI0010757A44|nr:MULTISPECIES: hypothetical protein [unclassified Nocardia]QBS44354.1 hypothetical protein DMB37_34005 [Nocardia sp. CS682]
MTVIDHRPTRIAGAEPGTALLAAATCLALTIGVAAMTQSVVATVAACAAIVVGLVVVLNILSHKA